VKSRQVAAVMPTGRRLSSDPPRRYAARFSGPAMGHAND